MNEQILNIMNKTQKNVFSHFNPIIFMFKTLIYTRTQFGSQMTMIVLVMHVIPLFHQYQNSYFYVYVLLNVNEMKIELMLSMLENI